MGESHNLQFRWLRKLPSQFLSQVILIDRLPNKIIIAILDKFEILTNSISEGLPREINLRAKKQYEYYRDLLLSFPKSNV